MARSCTKLSWRSARAELVRARDRHQMFLEHVAVGLEAGRVQVGDVVGDDVELALQRHLPRQSDEKAFSIGQAPHCTTRHERSHAHAGPCVTPPALPRRRHARLVAGAVPRMKIRLIKRLADNGGRRGRQKAPPSPCHPANFSQRAPSNFVNHSEPSLPLKARRLRAANSRRDRALGDGEGRQQAEAEAEAAEERKASEAWPKGEASAQS